MSAIEQNDAVETSRIYIHEYSNTDDHNGAVDGDGLGSTAS